MGFSYFFETADSGVGPPSCSDLPGAGGTSGTRPPSPAPLLNRVGLVPLRHVPHRWVQAAQRLSIQTRGVLLARLNL